MIEKSMFFFLPLPVQAHAINIKHINNDVLEKKLYRLWKKYVSEEVKICYNNFL